MEERGALESAVATILEPAPRAALNTHMSARVLDCPQCGAPVPFRSSITVFAVCEHCRSMIVLRGADAERIGVMAALPPDLSPFQIGTRGEWKGRAFEIIGRIRVEWEQGSWNEWCILHDGKTHGWLAEAQGLLMLSFPREITEQVSDNPDDYTPQHHLTLDRRAFTITDVKTATYRASEGELPFPAPPETRQTSVDLINTKGGFASIEISSDGADVYLGEFADFDALKLTNLRPVPGWSAEIAQEKNRTTALSCPVCGAVVDLRAVGQSMSAVCGSCGSLLDTATPEVQLIEKAETEIKKLAPLLPIGQRGKLFGTEYEVIGLVKRADQWSEWSEYLLFNPWQGFRWLVSFKGHWSFVTRAPSMPNEVGQRRIRKDGRKYKLFASGQATVTGVLGEFYWQVRRGEEAMLADYVAPPHILSRESYPGLVEVAWSEGEYVERRVIGDAFAVEKLPRPEGIYLNQPNRFAKRWREVRLLFVLALLTLCLVQCSSVVQRPEKEVAQAGFVFTRPRPIVPPFSSTFDPTTAATEPAKIFTTPRFQLEGGEQRVVVVVTAPVSNNWIGFDVDLVNTKTNAVRSGALEVSLYQGRDSDGAWSEGGPTSRLAFAAVPPGEYFFTLEPSADPSLENVRFNVRVQAGGVFNSNFPLMLGLILVYPAFLLWRGTRFEARRWEESDYSP